jgi:hypothetical protein
METVEVVIRIPKDMYDRITDESNMFYSHAVANGTVLSKGHGDLIDREQCIKKAWNNFYTHEDEMEQIDEEYLSKQHRVFEQNGFTVCQQTLVNSEAVIEADKEKPNLTEQTMDFFKNLYLQNKDEIDRVAKEYEEMYKEEKSMTEGELNLYRNTYNAGKKDALEEYADRMKKSLKRIYGDEDVPINAVFELLDQYLKEALQG